MAISIDLVELLRQFLAIDAVPANAMRNQGRGTAQKIQRELLGIDLESVDRSGIIGYRQWLDDRRRAF
jgi:hypothetical protein